MKSYCVIPSVTIQVKALGSSFLCGALFMCCTELNTQWFKLFGGSITQTVTIQMKASNNQYYLCAACFF